MIGRNSPFSRHLGTDPDLSKSMVPIHCGPSKPYVYLPVCESGGISLEWYKMLLPGNELAEWTTQFRGCRIAIMMFLPPYIAGTNAPEYNSLAKGIFYGISAVHTKEDFHMRYGRCCHTF